MMAPSLESIKGGGGSIKVGTTGTISNLMLRELQSAKCVSQTPITRNKTSLASVSIPSGPSTPRKLKPRTSPGEASSSSSSSNQSKNLKSSSDIAASYKGKYQNRTSHHIPMLNSDNISLEATPIRQNKPNKKGAYMVEVVDIKCGNPDKAWANPITSRLKKLGFSKLSETIA
ncbi:uncharacterized protein LOC124938403 [Impatiens glandulifera]|uniref:uncharacterized protein LOC124938403 n=1 Tax=Impatiens glandulifera TaxID=253017 RepID=UPI001FB0D029|nr:uncharacterized protein LOC124938403 [Impatiens glandulifera]